MHDCSVRTMQYGHVQYGYTANPCALYMTALPSIDVGGWLPQNKSMALLQELDFHNSTRNSWRNSHHILANESWLMHSPVHIFMYPHWHHTKRLFCSKYAVCMVLFFQGNIMGRCDKIADMHRRQSTSCGTAKAMCCGRVKFYFFATSYFAFSECLPVFFSSKWSQLNWTNTIQQQCATMIGNLLEFQYCGSLVHCFNTHGSSEGWSCIPEGELLLTFHLFCMSACS